jgi:indole-3-glycerol phosphate synthase
MPVGLDHIVAATRQKVAEKRRTADLRELERRAEEHVPRGFRKSLEKKGRDSVAIVAELKKASPSRGLIRSDFDVERLAREMESAGAAALSVLTDEEFFQGSLENLQVASSATQLPCLRKDFIVDEFQLLEARAYCADAVLLIVAALSQSELTGLVARAAGYNLDVLSEVHDSEDLQRALGAGCDLIGVNNRDLRTFKVDSQTAFRLAEQIPENAMRLAESGIQTGEDIAQLRLVGYRAFLIGESLMRAAAPGEALRALMTQAAGQYSTPTELTTGN